MHRNCLLSKQQEKNSVLQGKTQKFSQKLNAPEPRSTHRFQSDAQKKAWSSTTYLWCEAQTERTAMLLLSTLSGSILDSVVNLSPLILARNKNISLEHIKSRFFRPVSALYQI